MVRQSIRFWSCNQIRQIKILCAWGILQVPDLATSLALARTKQELPRGTGQRLFGGHRTATLDGFTHNLLNVLFLQIGRLFAAVGKQAVKLG